MTARRKALTTKDVDRFPNFLSGSLTLSAANTFTTNQVFTPIPRLKTSGNRATVMELLWMQLNIDRTTVDFVVNGDGYTFQMTFGSPPTGIIQWSDPRVVFEDEKELSFITSGMAFIPLSIKMDLQSEDGYGYLFASDAFNINATTTGMAVATRFNWKIYYRFVDIPLSEFVGLVQSTQQS